MSSHRREGLLFILVGPTGAGKNTIMNRVLKRFDDLHQLPTATTREIRANEKEGREHHFISWDEFEQMIDNNELLEHQNVHGRLYGVPRQTVAEAVDAQQDRIADIDVLGAMNVRAAFPDNTVIVFVQPGASENVIETVRSRLKQRGEKDAEIENRLKRVPLEMSYAPLCDYLIVNEEIDHATEMLYGIILAERSRRTLINLRAQSEHPRHRVLQTAATLITHEDRILLKDGELPLTTILPGEYPIEAAARSLPDTITAEITRNLSLTVHTEDRYDSLIFWYHGAQLQPATLPEGWAWGENHEVEIPLEVRNKLSSVSV